MAEAEAVLAQTNEYFNARKRALVERHLEGRESLPDLDHIVSRAPDDQRGSNYLDEHDAELVATQEADDKDWKEREEQEHQEKAHAQAQSNAKRSQLFSWNEKIDKEFGLDDLP